MRLYDAEYIAELVDEERTEIEVLLGCGFVAAQSEITRIVSRVKWLHDRVKRDGHRLTGTTAEKHGMFKAFSPPVGRTAHAQIEVINAFANYFKHHEEWGPKWKKATRKDAKKTIEIVKALGAAENSSDNCRKGLAALGIDQVSEAYTIAKIIARWQGDLLAAYREELASLRQ